MWVFTIDTGLKPDPTIAPDVSGDKTQGLWWWLEGGAEVLAFCAPLWTLIPASRSDLSLTPTTNPNLIPATLKPTSNVTLSEASIAAADPIAPHQCVLHVQRGRRRCITRLTQLTYLAGLAHFWRDDAMNLYCSASGCATRTALREQG